MERALQARFSTQSKDSEGKKFLASLQKLFSRGVSSFFLMKLEVCDILCNRTKGHSPLPPERENSSPYTRCMCERVLLLYLFLITEPVE